MRVQFSKYSLNSRCAHPFRCRRCRSNAGRLFPPAVPETIPTPIDVLGQPDQKSPEGCGSRTHIYALTTISLETISSAEMKARKTMFDSNRRRFSSALQDAIERRGMTLKSLAEGVDSTYEHMRRLVRGLAYPSRHLLHSIALELRVDFETLQTLLELDQIYEKYGGIPKFLIPSPETRPLREAFLKLSPCNQEIVIAAAKIMINHQKQ